MLALVRMGDLAGRRPGMLSGGQQQRVALARALAPEPRLLLLDEPLSALDLKLRQEMRFELKQLQEKTGVTFVFVTHDQDEALAMSDRIAVLDRGEIVQVGTPAELYERPAAHFVAAFLGNSNFLKARIQRASGGGVTVVVADSHCFPGAPGLADFAEKDVVLAVRPERIRIGHPSASAPKAQVERVVYLGPTIEVHLRAGDTGIVAHVSSSDAQANHISRGALVGFSIPPDAFRRIPK
jgi:spermidine/putrescine transport system ATP-binding protein